MSIICIRFFIFSWVDICKNKIIRQQRQEQKFTFFWKHKKKTYLVFTPCRRCCFVFQKPKWEKENTANYVLNKTNFFESISFNRKMTAKNITVFYISLQQELETLTILICGLENVSRLTTKRLKLYLI